MLIPAPAEEPGIPCQSPELGHLYLLAVEPAPPSHHLRLLDNPARNIHIRRHKMERKRDPETRVPGTPALLIRTSQTGVPHRIPVPAPSHNPLENDRPRARHRSAFAWPSATPCAIPCLALPAPPFSGEILRPSAPSASRASPAESQLAELASPLSVHHRQHGNPRTCLRPSAPARRLPKEKPQNLQQQSGGP